VSKIARRDFKVRTVDGVNIAVREVRPEPHVPGKTPMVLMHGTRIPGISEYDLPAPGGSLAETLALAGHTCFIPDARGFGGSDRSSEMDEDPSQSRPLVRSIEIVRDIDAAVDELRRTTGSERVGLMGWGVGATVVLMYAAFWPEKVSHLVLYNVLYGGVEGHARYRDHPLEDPARPGHFNQAHYGGYSLNDPDMLMTKWAQSIPVEDKDSWRDPKVAEAFRQALIDGDPASTNHEPPRYRSPNGMLEDSFYMGRGDKLIHASQVYCDVLIMRPQLDYFSRPGDVKALVADLVNSPRVETWEPENMTHFVIVDRDSAGRAEAVNRILTFIGNNTEEDS